MVRVALYARYSSDNQRAASIEDQFRICREHAKREKWKVASAYKDAGISGSSMILRPGIQTLLQDAQRGEFTIVLAEALDRISRDQADVATLFKHLKFAGVTIVTLAEGEISELHVGLKGTMNALFLKDLAAKTHRGLRGRVEDGKSGGGLCYGYKVIKKLDARGEPIRGDREIDPNEATVIRRIFRDFAAGVGPRAIARTLNDEGILGPNGKPWIDTTIRGHAQRGTGIVNNELYVGRLIWNRLRYIKDPSTGKRVSRPNPPDAWITTEVPELRIVDDALWQAVRNRQAKIAAQYVNVIAAVRTSAANRMNGMRRPKSLFSGMIFCGVCGGTYSLREKDRYACSNRVTNRSCHNPATILRSDLEERVLVGLKHKLMTPEAAAAAMKAYTEETNRLNHERRANSAGWKAELAKVEKGIAGIMTAIENGMFDLHMKARMQELRDREVDLNALLSSELEDTLDIHPNVAAMFKKKVERLTESLNQPEDRAEASEAVRALVEKIVLSPGDKRGEIFATLYGELGTLLRFVNQRDTKSGKSLKGLAKTSMWESVVAGEGNQRYLRLADRQIPRLAA
ncbi:recombinase family protein [Gluconacetobacter sp. Hr-1-5]|uniref:recombinase family protein n=1 Tax=Gluconacetobacter sp. Hr-1-5 TaxID=3395370 RepID=UPI003B523991